MKSGHPGSGEREVRTPGAYIKIHGQFQRFFKGRGRAPLLPPGSAPAVQVSGFSSMFYVVGPCPLPGSEMGKFINLTGHFLFRWNFLHQRVQSNYRIQRIRGRRTPACAWILRLVRLSAISLLAYM
jgi:hypothetical protein